MPAADGYHVVYRFGLGVQSAPFAEDEPEGKLASDLELRGNGYLAVEGDKLLYISENPKKER